MSEGEEAMGETRILHPVFICGGESDTARQRDRENRCPSVLHDWPLPRGYVDAETEAMWRLRNGWRNPRCHDCEMFGWVAGKTTAEHVRRPVEVSA